MMRSFLVSYFRCELALFVLLSTASLAYQAPTAPSAAEQRAADYVAAHYQRPEEYVVGKFKDHDIVFAGEAAHLHRQSALFLQRLIPMLYRAGVRNLCYEMSLADDQAE